MPDDRPDSRASISFDAKTRNMLRALCNEYGMTVAQVVRQLVRAQYHALFPGQTPRDVTVRQLDRDGGRGKVRSDSE
jgi:hypothetical protein